MTSPPRLGAVAPVETLPTELDAIAASLNVDPGVLKVERAAAIDLDTDGTLDRVVIVSRARARPHALDLADPHWTFVLLKDGPVQLANAGCSGERHEFLGAIDLDGDGRLEVVMLFQYQVVLYRLDGTVLLEGESCCGLG